MAELNGAGLTNKRHKVTRNEYHYVSQTYFADISFLFIIDLHIFLYTDIHSLMMTWRTFEETTDKCAVLAFMDVTMCVFLEPHPQIFRLPVKFITILYYLSKGSQRIFVCLEQSN